MQNELQMQNELKRFSTSCRKPQNCPKFQTKMPRKDQKIKKLKICEMAASVPCRWSPMPIFSPNRPPSGSNVKLAAKIRIQILTIFLYKWPKTAENDLTLTDHISATVRS